MDSEKDANKNSVENNSMNATIMSINCPEDFEKFESSTIQLDNKKEISTFKSTPLEQSRVRSLDFLFSYKESLLR